MAKRQDDIRLDASEMIDQSQVDLDSHSVQLKVLILLQERIAGASEVAKTLGVDVSTAAENLEQMLDLNLIEVADDIPRRGKAEPRYRALVRALISNAEWATLSLEDRQRLAAWIVQMINTDVGEALAAGTFSARPDAHTGRTVSLVDEQGWRELNRIQNEALEAIFDVQAACAERLAESGEEGFPAMSAMLTCELPARRLG